MPSEYLKGEWCLATSDDGAWTLETRHDDGRTATVIAMRAPWPSRAEQSLFYGRLCKAAPKMYEALQRYISIRKQIGQMSDEDLVRLQAEFHEQVVTAMAEVDGAS